MLAEQGRLRRRGVHARAARLDVSDAAARPLVRTVALATACAAVMLATVGAAAAQDTGRERQRERCVCMNYEGFPGAALRLGAFAPGARAQIGVTLASDTDVEDGAPIARVAELGPAARAGLQAGDVITALNGHSLLEPLDDEERVAGASLPSARLIALLRRVEPGDTVQVEYRRGDRTHTASVVTRPAGWLAIAPLDSALWRFRTMPELRGAITLPRIEALGRAEPAVVLGGRFWARTHGLELTDLNPEMADYFGASEGVLVLRAESDSPLQLRAGDVIRSIGGRPVTSARHALDILRSYRAGEAIVMEVVRRGSTITVEAHGR